MKQVSFYPEGKIKTMFHIYNIQEKYKMKKQTNLNLQVETNHRLKELSKELGIPQNIIVNQLIDNYYINNYQQQKDDTGSLFTLLKT